MDLDLQVEKATQDLVLAAIRAGFVASAHDVSEGGLAIAFAESLFTPVDAGPGHSLGATASLNMDVAKLFSESQGRFVLSVPARYRQDFEALAGKTHVPFALVGEVTGEAKLVLNAANVQVSVEVGVARNAWENAIPNLLK